jgi:hypothetical protein
MSDPGPNLIAALALAGAGMKIFPAGADKRPLFAGWQEIATTERDVISDWWRRAPYALPAIPCGTNALVVIDLDRHGNGSDGVSAFKALVASHGALPPGVPMVKTPNKGFHLYFRQPPGEPLGNGRGTLPAGCDVRGAGGFVIGPGATLPDGRGWIRVAERPPVTQAAQLMWIESVLKRPAEPPREEHPAGETSDPRGRAYAERALHEIEHELAATGKGERNEKLYKAAFRLGTMAARGWLTEGEIEGALRCACQANGLVKDDGAAAFRKTFESGLSDGLKVPHEDLKDREQTARHYEHTGDAKGSTKVDQGQRRQQRNTGSWDEPDLSILDNRRGELPDLPTAAIPSSVVEWIDAAAKGAGVTADHVATPFFGVASGLLGIARRVQATRSWRTPATMWACLIWQSGSGKTPAIDVTKRALSFIEHNRTSEIAALQLAHDTRQEAAKAALKRWKDQVAEAVEAGQPPPPKPEQASDIKPFVAPRLYVNDSTIERLAPLLEARPRGIIYIADELARLFLNMQRYSGGSDREFWLEAWDGKSFVVERLNRPPIAVPHLLVGVVGGFQPDKMCRSFEGDADGVYARFLYAWPKEPPFAKPANSVEEIEPEVINALTRLVRLPDHAGEAFVPRDVALAPEALEAFAAFAAFAHQGKDELDGREREYFCKGTAHVLRLAGTLAFLDWSWAGGPEPQEIERRHVEGAATLFREYYWPHARAALRQMGITDKHADSRRVLRWLKANRKPQVAREEVRVEALGKRHDADQTQTIIDSLVRAGWLQERTVPTAGRYARRWDVNPRLYSL